MGSIGDRITRETSLLGGAATVKLKQPSPLGTTRFPEAIRAWAARHASVLRLRAEQASYGYLLVKSGQTKDVRLAGHPPLFFKLRMKVLLERGWNGREFQLAQIIPVARFDAREDSQLGIYDRPKFRRGDIGLLCVLL